MEVRQDGGHVHSFYISYLIKGCYKRESEINYVRTLVSIPRGASEGVLGTNKSSDAPSGMLDKVRTLHRKFSCRNVRTFASIPRGACEEVLGTNKSTDAPRRQNLLRHCSVYFPNIYTHAPCSAIFMHLVCVNKNAPDGWYIKDVR